MASHSDLFLGKKGEGAKSVDSVTASTKVPVGLSVEMFAPEG